MAHFACVSQQAFTQKCVSALEDDFQSGPKGNLALGALSRERVLPRAPHGGEAWEGCAVRVAVGPGALLGGAVGTATSTPRSHGKLCCCTWVLPVGCGEGWSRPSWSKLGPNKGILKSSIVPRSGQTPSSGPPPWGPQGTEPVLPVYRGL